MPRPDDTPRDLLFGLLALQIGLIDQDQLLAAFGAWSRAKDKALAEILLERGSIDEEERTLLAGMAEKQLKRHGGDTEKSLATLTAGPSIREGLAAIGDTELTAVLNRTGETTLPRDATITRPVGQATGDGQRFRVLRPHAQGGLGAVFVALDGELKREVALKQILDRHADDPASRSRFLIEAEITGGLEHPGIVPVYGLGRYEDGRPYYAMRFIRGDSLKEAIAAFHADDSLKRDPGKRSLALRKLMRRFVDVCNAIDYAHGRGILHRDLKPGNVIVGKHGETLVVDWGLAKPMGHSEAVSRSDERTLIPSSNGSAVTLPGSAIGTPAYMSPEQATGDLDRLGPRSDVYSLGATLYCLLTGRPPFEAPYLGAVLHAVEKGEFPPPRQVDPSIDKALEAVCLKAMAVDPDSRHATARALADDVERWAADEPVSAWREPATARVRRWMRRNRTAVMAASAAVLMAVVGLAGMLAVQSIANAALKAKNGELDRANAREFAANRGLREANDRVSRAVETLEARNTELDKANRLKDEANAGLLEANTKVQARFDLAREAIRSFQAGVTDDDVLKGEELKGLRNKLLRSAAGFYEKLEKLLQGQADRASRATLAQSYFELGELTDKIGVKPEALAVHRKALAIRRELADGPEAVAQARLDLARSLIAEGLLAEATGANGRALSAFQEARDLAGPTATDDETREVRGRALGRVARILSVTGKPAEALASYREALSIQQGLARDHPAAADSQGELARTHNAIGVLQTNVGRPAEALASYREALAIRRKLAEDRPIVAQFRRDLAISLHNLGLSQFQNARPADGLASFREALAIQRRLAEENPAVTQFRRDLASTLSGLGNLHKETGDTAEALASFREGLAIGRKLVDDNPAVVEFRRELASGHNNIGGLHMATGHPEKALPSYLEALAIRRVLAEEVPAGSLYRNNLAASHYNLGILYAQVGRLDEALASYREAMTIYKKLSAENPASAAFRTTLAMGHNNIGTLQARSGRRPEALASFREALALQRKLAADGPASLDARSNLADALSNIGSLLQDDGQQSDALACHLEAMAIRRTLADDHPTYLLYLVNLAESHANIGTFRSRNGQRAEALASYLEALAIRRKLAEDHPDVLPYRRDLALSHGQLGRGLARTSEPDAAASEFRRSIAILERLPETPDWLFDLAWCRAMLAEALAGPESGTIGDEREATALAAVSALKRAIELGYRDFDAIKTVDDLDSLRSRPDFQVLVMDLGFPSDPFAR